MSMTQLVIGAALGFIVAQGALYGARHAIGWLQRAEPRKWIRELRPAAGSSLVGSLIRYSGPIAAGIALLTLGVWAVGDYLTAKHAGGPALTGSFDLSANTAATDAPGASDEMAGLAPPKDEPARAIAAVNIDPYSDAAFKVHRRPHRAGAALNLKESLLQRSEARARAALLQETQQHAQRSQYDCEAADRAGKYLKADLDVWGFATWQLKYFPIDAYRGATLAKCKAVKNVVDPSLLDLRSTVAQQTRP